MAEDKTPAECTRMCVKDGMMYALAVDKKLYTLEGHEAELSKHSHTNPPGTTTMTRLKEQIRYELSETDRGARIRLVTSSPETTDAVHAFLLFQIVLSCAA